MHQTSDTAEAMVTEFKKEKKKKYWHCFQISRLHCPRAQKDTTQHLRGALAAILSIPSLVTMVCAFDSTYSCAHFGHACSMTLQVELMQKTNGKENSWKLWMRQLKFDLARLPTKVNKKHSNRFFLTRRQCDHFTPNDTFTLIYRTPTQKMHSMRQAFFSVH